MKYILFLSLAFLNGAFLVAGGEGSQVNNAMQEAALPINTTSIAAHIVEQKNSKKKDIVTTLAETSHATSLLVNTNTSSNGKFVEEDDSYDDYMKDRSSK